MRIVSMVLALTPYGVLALIAHVMATSDYAAILDLGKFVAVSYGALAFMFLVHCLHPAGEPRKPARLRAQGVPPCSASPSWRGRAQVPCR